MIQLAPEEKAGVRPGRHVRIRLERAPGRELPGRPVPAGATAAVAVRWMALLVGAVLVARSAPAASPLLWGLPLAAMACLRTLDGPLGIRRSPWATAVVTVAEVGLAIAASARTGGWHSGWAVVLVAAAALAGWAQPERWAGQVAAAAVILLLLANVGARRYLVGSRMYSLDLDGLLVVTGLVVAYATWLARFGDGDRASLARTNERLMATNDLLVRLEQVVLEGEDVTDPQHAARGVARLARELLEPDVIAIVSAAGTGDTWRMLLAEGVTADVVEDHLEAIRRAAVAAEHGAPVISGPGPALLGESSRMGACVPLAVRGRVIGALILEVSTLDRWKVFHQEIMGELGHWAALLIDNACRLHSLWVVGSTEERARVARSLHDSLGQSMAALGLQLDWLARTVGSEAHAAHIKELRAGVTGMVAELRYTMKDLCCDVSADRTLGEALEQLVGGMAGRTGAELRLETSGSGRLAVAHEHQVLQMARVLVGAAVESGASTVRIRWTVDAGGGCLEVDHDAAATVGPEWAGKAPMSAAVAEVRERCWAVGATLEWEQGGGAARVRVAA